MLAHALDRAARGGNGHMSCSTRSCRTGTTSISRASDAYGHGDGLETESRLSACALGFILRLEKSGNSRAREFDARRLLSSGLRRLSVEDSLEIVLVKETLE